MKKGGEILHRVFDIAIGYNFQDSDGNIIDWLKLGVWWDEYTRSYRTSKHYGWEEVFLCSNLI